METCTYISEENSDSNNSLDSKYSQCYKNNYRTADFSTQQRRETFLNKHKEKHTLVFDERRDLSEIFEEYDCTSDEAAEELMEVEKPPRRRRIKFRVTMSEWFVEIPDDLSEKWLVKFCPQGKRRLIISDKGKTKCFNKFGQKISEFGSHLPGGSRKRSQKGGLTVLDCVIHEATRTYFILDMLVWNSVSFLDCEAELRHSWLRSRYLESPELFSAYGMNSFAFKVLLDHPADAETINSEMWRYDSQNDVVCDGLIFFHKEAPYVSGQNPLVTWLRPFMLPEKFNISIPQEYENKRPSNYSNMESYLNSMAERRKKKTRMEMMETE